MTLPCRKDYVVERDDHQMYTFDGGCSNIIQCGGRRSDSAQDFTLVGLQDDAGILSSLCPPPSPPLLEETTSSSSISPLEEYLNSSNETSAATTPSLSPLSPQSPIPLAHPLSPLGITLDALLEDDTDGISRYANIEGICGGAELGGFLHNENRGAIRGSCDSIYMDDLCISDNDAAMEDEDDDDEDEDSLDDSSTDEMVSMPTSPIGAPFSQDDIRSSGETENSLHTLNASADLASRKKALLDSILAHHLLPHFKHVQTFITNENFMPLIGDEDVKMQQQRLLEVSSFPSFDDFLKTEVVGLLEQPELLRKIADMRRVYDNEVRKLERYSAMYVDRLVLLLEDHHQIRTVTEQEIKVKAMMIYSKFQLLRCMITKTISDQVRLLLDQHQQKMQQQLLHQQHAQSQQRQQTQHIIITPPLLSSQHIDLQTEPAFQLTPPLQQTHVLAHAHARTHAHTSPAHNMLKSIKREYPSSPPLKSTPPSAASSSSLKMKKECAPVERTSPGSKNMWFPTSFSRKTWKEEICRAGYRGSLEDGKSDYQTESVAPQPAIKKRRKKSLSRAATEVLNMWFNDHIHDPYPTEKEKRQLASSLNIHLSQVNNWFGNKRIRHKRKMAEMGGDFRYASHA